MREENLDGPGIRFVFSVTMFFLLVLFFLSVMKRCETGEAYSGKAEPIPPVEDSIYIAGSEI